MRDVDSILEKLRPELEALETARQGVLVRRRKALKQLVLTAMVILGLGSLIAVVAGTGLPLIVAAILALVASIVLGIRLTAPTTRLRREFKVKAIGAIVRTMEPEMTFSPERGIPAARFVESNLFTKPDRYNSEDGLYGKIGDTQVHISEIHAEKKHT